MCTFEQKHFNCNHKETPTKSEYSCDIYKNFVIGECKYDYPSNHKHKPNIVIVDKVCDDCKKAKEKEEKEKKEKEKKEKEKKEKEKKEKEKKEKEKKEKEKKEKEKK
ncbi:hypothetical protein B0T26DRAFT_805999 [Lasiosphaeria miniovina]|uniref:Uncharacterized protein n=1 Tax=Lasiosphaeria miniovina TaxID=1954250 RepID=A0AA40DNB5_9PEZI|nr:uncharacterized protein B0T26DRAFT_805999 [Lasiosphaeria miniovina]KAK0706143.1 hypothetical protein B0T26DRAFT_805999 [Lasiosphaeria miniovina]